MVCQRFSASSKTMERRALEDLVRHLQRLKMELLADLAANAGVEVMERRQAVHEQGLFSGGVHELLIDLIGEHLLQTLGPGFHRLAHGDPDVGVEHVRTGDRAFAGSVSKASVAPVSAAMASQRR